MANFNPGDRVAVKASAHNSYIQPWRGRFKAGRKGTVQNTVPGEPCYVFVMFDHCPGGRVKEHEWKLAIRMSELVLVDPAPRSRPKTGEKR